MDVTVDYLVVCSGETDLSGQMGLIELLTETLKSALESVDEEPPETEALEQQIAIRYTKIREDSRWACGFSVTFDSTEERMEDLINNFSEFVADYTADCTDDRIKHLLKLNDPQLQRTLRDYGKEIFEIEMKLREALSLIFADTYGKDFYELLNETNVTPVTPPPQRTAKLMNKSYENEFFHLVFSQYIHINNSKKSDLDRDKIEEYIEQAEDLEDLSQLITPKQPITKTGYVDFLESLKKRVDPIEKLRNCVAHNRSIPEDIIKNYKEAKGPLLEKINEFLNSQTSHEAIYETETRN